MIEGLGMRVVAYTSALKMSLMHTICMVKMSTTVVMCVLYENFYVVNTTLTIHYQRLEPSGLYSDTLI